MGKLKCWVNESLFEAAVNYFVSDGFEVSYIDERAKKGRRLISISSESIKTPEDGKPEVCEAIFNIQPDGSVKLGGFQPIPEGD